MVARTSFADLVGLFEALGLDRGDIAMVHCSLFTLGVLPEGPKTLLDALRWVLGEEGTVVVPTFTYSYRRGEVFDVRETPSDPAIGVFSEFVRRSPGAIRSLCPQFSMASVGMRAETLMYRDGPACFGPGSIYQRLFDEGVKTIALGVPYSRGLSAFMHFEKLAGVPYRRDLPLSGRTIGYDGVVFEDSAIHFARDEVNYVGGFTDRENMGRELEAAGIAKVCRLSHSAHVLLPAAAWRDHVVGRLKSDPLAMFREI